MPIDVSILDDGKGFYWYGSGDISGEDILDATRETYRCKQRWLSIRYSVVDFSAAEASSVQAEAVQAAAVMDAEAAKLNPDVVIALVSSEDIGYGMIRMWEFFVDELVWKTRAFRSLDEAEQWICDTANVQSPLSFPGKLRDQA